MQPNNSLYGLYKYNYAITDYTIFSIQFICISKSAFHSSKVMRFFLLGKRNTDIPVCAMEYRQECLCYVFKIWTIG